MEDYNSNLLNDSKNEWSIRLMNILSGHIIDGFRAIFNESLNMCEENEEPEKYLMTFQNFLSRIPKWNQTMIEKEVERISTNSKCNYLQDLITCVHIIQLKILSCVRTSNHSKKIEIDIPVFSTFLHNVYINIARKLYSNIYLFQIDNTPLEQQKNNREFEIIVQTCIMNTIRDNIPIDQLLKQYIDETQEFDVESKETIIEKPIETPVQEKSEVTTSTTTTNETVSNDTPASEETELAKNEANIAKPDTPVVEDLPSVSFSSDVKAEESLDTPAENIIDLNDEVGEELGNVPINIGNPLHMNIVDDTLEPQDNDPMQVQTLDDVVINFEDIDDDNSQMNNSEPEAINLGIEELPL